MKKSELVAAMAQASGISRAAASAALDGALDAIRAALRDGETVRLVGFRVFEVRALAVRMDSSPQAGEPATNIPKFAFPDISTTKSADASAVRTFF